MTGSGLCYSGCEIIFKKSKQAMGGRVDIKFWLMLLCTCFRWCRILRLLQVPPHFPPHPCQHSTIVCLHGSCWIQSTIAYHSNHSSLQSWETTHIQMAFPLPLPWLSWQRYTSDIMKIAFSDPLRSQLIVQAR